MMISSGLFIMIAGIAGVIVFLALGIKFQSDWSKEREKMKYQIETELGHNASQKRTSIGEADTTVLQGTETCIDNVGEVKICGNCGAVFTSEVIFCENCGTKIG